MQRIAIRSSTIRNDTIGRIVRYYAVRFDAIQEDIRYNMRNTMQFNLIEVIAIQYYAKENAIRDKTNNTIKRIRYNAINK